VQFSFCLEAGVVWPNWYS